jgi:hypothetical protein
MAATMGTGCGVESSECTIDTVYNALQEGLCVLDARNERGRTILCAQPVECPAEELDSPDAFTFAVVVGSDRNSALEASLRARWSNLKQVKYLSPSLVPSFCAAFPWVLVDAEAPAAYTGPFPNSMGDGVFLGSAWHAENPACISTCGFGAVVNCMGRGGCPPEVAAALGVSTTGFSWEDSEDCPILPDLPAAVAAIEAGRGQRAGVFVHCMVGMSRSAAAVCAWWLWKRGGEVATVHAAVKAHRCIVNVNAGFRQQLSVWRECVLAAGGPGCRLEDIKLPHSP